MEDLSSPESSDCRVPAGHRESGSGIVAAAMGQALAGHRTAVI